MPISDESLQKFIAAYKESYGQELSVAEARPMAARLLFLYEQLARPLPGEVDPTLPPTRQELPPSPPEV